MKEKVDWQKLRENIQKQDEREFKLKEKEEKLKEKIYRKTTRGKVGTAIRKVASRVNKWAEKPQKNRQVLKEQSRVQIDLRQPVYTKDKSRFFKTAWEEEKRQLFFK